MRSRQAYSSPMQLGWGFGRLVKGLCQELTTLPTTVDLLRSGVAIESARGQLLHSVAPPRFTGLTASEHEVVQS